MKSTQKALEVVNQLTEGRSDLHTFIEGWAQENGSDVEMWGKASLWQKIRAILDSGGTVKSFAVNTDESSGGDLRELARSKAKGLFDKGYSELAFEDNIDQAELLVASPRVTESARHLGFSQAASWADGIESSGERLASIIDRTPGHYPKELEQRIKNIYADLSDLVEFIEMNASMETQHADQR